VKLLKIVFAASLAAASIATAGDAGARQDVLVVVGAAGTEEYTGGFADAANAWRQASEKGDASISIIGLEPNSIDGTEDRELFEKAMEAIEATGTRPVWIVYIGHGTYDRRVARLNLRGTDVTETELEKWLERFERPLIFVHGGSASGMFINKLSGPNRVIVTATQSGAEVNYARFGEFFAHAIGSQTADIDQDEQTSILEAFVSASAQTRHFYEEAGRMMTEHALIDDNGDSRGTPADWYSGTRTIKNPADDSSPDGTRANRIALVENDTERQLTPDQRALRDALESELEALRARKASMLESIYLNELEILFRKLAPIYVPGVEGGPEPETNAVPSQADS
jgi:hypothetical protein